MVSGINLNNYTAAQLQELQKAGVQISNEDIEAAKKREEEANANKADDEANVSYTITDDAGEVNEAEQEVKTAAEYGTNLKGILETLISKCETKIDEMAQLQEELDKFQVETEKIDSQVGEVNEEAKEIAVEMQTEQESLESQLMKKMEELNAKREEAEALCQKENPTEEDLAKLDELENADAQLQEEIMSLQGQINTDAQAKLDKAKAKAESLGKTMEDVKNDAQSAANQAINANEYADVTIEKGMEAANIKDKGDAKAAGFTKRGGFLGLGKRKGNVKAANQMGNYAVATGEQLGGATKNIASGVQDVAKSYNFTFAKTSNVNELASKTYVDTSKFEEAKEQMAESKSFRAWGRNYQNLKSSAADVTEASRNKNNFDPETAVGQTLNDLVKKEKKVQ